VNEKKVLDRTGKKSQKGCISPICGEAPIEAMYMILQGVEYSIFPIDFEWALQQCSATALPVI